VKKSAEEIVNTLVSGNHRFIEKQAHELPRHVSGQSPNTAILTCSDSRVPLEHIFDAGVGEILAVEVAGNVAFESGVLGSLDYAVEHLHVPLLIILGHTNCGAVMAAEAGPGDDSPTGRIVSEIRQCFGQGDNIRANVLRQTRLLEKRSQIIARALKDGDLEVRGAIYHLENGMVEWL
jgi:carbonic anhydrase